MSDYFLSDVHLREDRPDRARRLVEFLRRVEPADRLFIAGDLCDFWMGARTRPAELARYPALAALAAFRSGGGSLTILPGNHDQWLCPFYRDSLGAEIAEEPYETTSHGLKLHIVHGHLLGARRKWKGVMESKGFFQGFGAVPSSIAARLDQVLETRNQRGLLEDEERHLAVFRNYADRRNEADLAIFGHVHRPVDHPGRPRMVVLGGWQQRSSHLRIDGNGAVFHVEGDVDDSPALTRNSEDPSHEAS